MQIGDAVRRFFAFPPKRPQDPAQGQGQPAAAAPGQPDPGQPPAGSGPLDQAPLRPPALKPDGEDVAALRKAEEQKALLAPLAIQLSPYLLHAFDPNGLRYNPDDLLTRKGFDVYQKMMLDEQVKAVVRFKIAALLSRGWQLYYPDECELPEDVQKERIAVTEAGLRNMGGSFKTGLLMILRCVWQGFSLTEKEHCRYEYRGETWIGLKQLMSRPFDTIHFECDEHGHIERCVQRVPGKQERDLPLNRFVYMVHNADIDPHYGQSDLREAYRAYFTKDMAIRMGNIHMERMAGGFVFLEQDSNANILPNSNDATAILALLKNMSAATGALLPKGVKANVVHPDTTDVFKLKEEACNLAIAKSLLVPNLLGITETGQTGSFSQSQTQFEAFLWTLDELGGSLEEVATEQIFKELGRANFADGEGPSFRLKPMSDAQKDAVLKQWNELLKSGAAEPSDTDEEHVRDLIDFPKKGVPRPKPAAPQVDPETGQPLPPDKELGPDGKVQDRKPQRPGDPPKPGAGQQPPARPAPMPETIRSGRVLHSAHGHQRRHMTAGERRFQFEVARRKTEGIEAASRAALKSAIKAGAAGMLSSARRMGPEAAMQLEALEFDKGSKSAVKAALRDGMVDAAALGIRLAAGEVAGARAKPMSRGPAPGPTVVLQQPAPAAAPRLREVVRTVRKRDAEGYAAEIGEVMVYDGEDRGKVAGGAA